MSEIPITDLKSFLDVIHDADDEKLQFILNGAEDEALGFMNRTTFAEICECDSNFDLDTASIPDAVKIAVFFLAQAMYQAAPGDIEVMRKAAERLMMPYRCEMGI